MAKEDYDEKYYIKCKEEGIDYAFYGSWQRQYSKLVVYMTGIYKMDYRDKAMLDLGCACGANLKGFKETGIFDKYYGVDISQYLIELGKDKLELSEDELKVAESFKLPFKNNTIDFIHCSHLFEYLDENEILDTLSEVKRILVEKGILLFTLSKNKKNITEWEEQFKKYFEPVEQGKIRELFSKGKFYPGSAEDIDAKKKRRTFYDYYGSEWFIFILKGR